MRRRQLVTALVGSAMLLGSSAFAVTWDMPTPYPDKTFHTQNIAQFAQDVEKKTDGKLKIDKYPLRRLPV